MSWLNISAAKIMVIRYFICGFNCVEQRRLKMKKISSDSLDALPADIPRDSSSKNVLYVLMARLFIVMKSSSEAAWMNRFIIVRFVIFIYFFQMPNFSTSFRSTGLVRNLFPVGENTEFDIFVSYPSGCRFFSVNL